MIFFLHIGGSPSRWSPDRSPGWFTRRSKTPIALVVVLSRLTIDQVLLVPDGGQYSPALIRKMSTDSSWFIAQVDATRRARCGSSTSPTDNESDAKARRNRKKLPPPAPLTRRWAGKTMTLRLLVRRGPYVNPRETRYNHSRQANAASIPRSKSSWTHSRIQSQIRTQYTIGETKIFRFKSNKRKRASDAHKRSDGSRW